MTLNCPVCGYQEVTSHSCPNCDTDLSVIRMLQELPTVETTVTTVKFKTSPLVIALLSLLVAICLGVGSRLIFQPPQLHALAVASPQPVVNSRVSSEPPIDYQPAVVQEPAKPTTYTVQSGDYLSAIAQKFCGRGTSWEIIVKANPQLQGRENYIDVGEVLNIPNCKEQA
ncbi:LysM peptidoglycan-binding domain-containing protein [Tolypothrix sp. FACHB-123]|uniref:LysM peptidoglycan-binding domain-containing protein n=1 Tax=Tolypothrix sp. FACHB-123 TaxID=2692868 RepID=UPI001F555527|nr:LysM peptidoglycan-binding domain-containing protein [Tolypothrix sp. FACHB-123]